MKKIGLVGGIGPASTVEYYLGLTEISLSETGEYPEIVIDSVNMLKHDAALNNREYGRVCEYLLDSVSALKSAGAEIAAITANTEHIVWDMVCDRFPLPVISITDSAVNEITRLGCRRILVFGTELTMRSRLYEKVLESNGLTAVSPSENDIGVIGNLIYPNLENGIVIPEDRKKLIDLAEKYIKAENADAMLLGCTELPLAVKPEDISVPVLNTAEIHIREIFRNANEDDDMQNGSSCSCSEVDMRSADTGAGQ